MNLTQEEMIVLLQATLGNMIYALRPENSLRAGYLRERAVRLIEIIDALPSKVGTNTTGVEE